MDKEMRPCNRAIVLNAIHGPTRLDSPASPPRETKKSYQNNQKKAGRTGGHSCGSCDEMVCRQRVLLFVCTPYCALYPTTAHAPMITLHVHKIFGGCVVRRNNHHHNTDASKIQAVGSDRPPRAYADDAGHVLCKAPLPAIP